MAAGEGGEGAERAEISEQVGESGGAPVWSYDIRDLVDIEGRLEDSTGSLVPRFSDQKRERLDAREAVVKRRVLFQRIGREFDGHETSDAIVSGVETPWAPFASSQTDSPPNRSTRSIDIELNVDFLTGAAIEFPPDCGFRHISARIADCADDHFDEIDSDTSRPLPIHVQATRGGGFVIFVCDLIPMRYFLYQLRLYIQPREGHRGPLTWPRVWTRNLYIKRTPWVNQLVRRGGLSRYMHWATEMDFGVVRTASISGTWTHHSEMGEVDVSLNDARLLGVEEEHVRCTRIRTYEIEERGEEEFEMSVGPQTVDAAVSAPDKFRWETESDKRPRKMSAGE